MICIDSELYVEELNKNMYGKWNGYMSIAWNVKLLVCGSVSLCGDFVLLEGLDPADIFLALMQALHRTRARWLDQNPHPPHKEISAY